MGMQYDKIRNMCESLGISKGKLTDEYLFTIHATDIFFYKQNIGVMDIKTGFIDGSGDGGIDFIYSDNEVLFLIQGKSSKNLSKEDMMNAYEKMIRTVIDFENKKYDQYSQKLKSAYLNAYDDLNDDKNINLVLFTKTIVTDKDKENIISSVEKDFINNMVIIDANDIENREATLYQQSDLIENDSILMYLNKDKKNDMLEYNNGFIVNIKASSLKKLYDKYGNNGLFSYNLREHISQIAVDNGIDKTIAQEKENFWYYNNGITIGCEDFVRDGYKIKLYNFSIINGAQTTTKIGKSKLVNEKNDFAIVCKIIRAENSIQKENDFIGKISEFSNSQKPIKQRDLKSNAKEQKILQMKCAKNKYPLAIEIKRGVTPLNSKKVDKWQRVTNEYVGQLIYSCLFQKPGVARNSKNTMFSSQKVYNQLFKRETDCDTLYDLVRMGYIYDQYANNVVKDEADLELIAVIKNGKLNILATTIYLVKKELDIVNSRFDDNLYKDNLSGLLVTDYPADDLEKQLSNIFSFIARKMKHIYESKKETMKLTSYSNFFKNDTIYSEIVLNEFDSLDDYDKEKLKSFMRVFVKKKNN